MPISKDRMKLYPGGSIRSEEWLVIRRRILDRANNACEGSPKYPDCRADNGKRHPVTGSLVCLTVGHVNQDATDNRPENLKAWCQRCHNAHDAPHRQLNASFTRTEKQGQGDLFGRPK